MQLSHSGARASDPLEGYDREGLTRTNGEFVDFVVKMVLRKKPLCSVDDDLFHKSVDEYGVSAMFENWQYM